MTGSTSFSRAFMILMIAGFCINGTLTVTIKKLEAKLGYPVLLKCIFTQTTYCVWMKNGKQINFFKSSRYKLNNPNYPTPNCSLGIKKLSEFDKGNWTCLKPSTDYSSGLELETYILSIKKDTSLTLSDSSNTKCLKNTTINYKKSKKSLKATISCLFNNPVKCYLKKNNAVVKLGKRYKEKKSKSPNVCIFNINKINPLDYGTWSCLTMATDEYDGVNCGNVTLAQYGAK
ncbi:hypothetical protein CHUAL_004725 [Chamberlinius hualienensis]